MAVSETLQAWRNANRNKVREISRRCYWKNREKQLARNKKWRENNQEYLKNWREQNKERLAAAGRKHEYGITQEEFESKLKQQDYKCAICFRHLDKPFVDHNHDTEIVRDLLCRDCNSMLGFAKDNIEILESAIQYLRRHDGLVNQ